MQRRECIALLTAGAHLRPPLIFPVQAAQAQQTLPNPAILAAAGPMLGPSEITATQIWLQTKRSCLAAVRFWKQGKPETRALSEIVRTTENERFYRQV
jgi:hypothetical protein